MTQALLRTTWLPALLLVPVALAMKDAAAPDSQNHQGHLSRLTAKITLADGTIKTATIEGLGCTESICSRVAIKGRSNDGSVVSYWLEGIAAIKDTTVNGASLVMKDGAERRISLITDFRVLYLASQTRVRERLDLTRIKSVEFLN